MLKNYVVIALRHLRRHRSYTLLTLSGLALAFCVSILLLLLARTLFTYDRFHDQADDVYLAYIDMDQWGTASTWAPLGPALADVAPAVQSFTRIYQDGHQINVLPPDGTTGAAGRFFQEDIVYVDPGFFDVFSFPLVQGDPAVALARPDAALLTEATARKFFGTANPMGRTLSLDGRSTLLVTGILRDVPTNSTLQFGVVAPYAHAVAYTGTIQAVNDDWNTNYLRTYVRLHPDADAEALKAQLPALLATFRADTDQPDFRLTLLPLTGVANYLFGVHKYAYTFLLLALGILGLGSINFTNLATARSLDRAREIGMRKVLGAHRLSVAGQFLCEAMLVSFAALALGLGLTQLLLPGFNDLLQGLAAVDLDLGEPVLWGSLVVLGLGMGLLAGGYPAFFLSRFRPTESLKGRLSSQPAGARLRNALVIFQFALTAFLIIGAVAMNQQMRLVEASGFDFGSQPVVVVPVSEYAFAEPAQGLERLHTFVRELERDPGVAAATVSSGVPGGEYWQSAAYGATQDPGAAVDMFPILTDEAFFATYGIRLVEGRATRQAGEVVLNEAALKALAWTTALGKTLYEGDRPLTVVGVAEDIHFASLHQAIRPATYRLFDEGSTTYQYVAVRATGTTAAPVLDQMRARWPALGLAQGFAYFFGDDLYAQQHRFEATLTRIVTLAAVFALLVALIGLIGISALVVAQRTKEIGVRKVLGASMGDLTLLLSRRFALLVLAALVLAFPPAFFAVQQWLNGFAYRAEPGAGLFLLAAALVLGTALLTVGLQAARAARANPVDSLRYE